MSDGSKKEDESHDDNGPHGLAPAEFSDLQELFDFVGGDLPSDITPSQTATEEEKAYYPGDEERAQEVKYNFHRVVIWGLRIASIALFILFLLRLWHLGAPSYLTWMSDDQLGTIDTVFYSSVVSSAGTAYVNSLLSK